MNDDHQPQRSSQRDARLTAFALGELNDDERAEIATACDGAERAAADETARLGGLLRRAWRDKPCPARSDDLRRAVEARLTERETVPPDTRPPVTLPPNFWPRRRVWLPLSLAASLLVISTTVVMLTHLPVDVALVAKNDIEARMGDEADGTPSVEGMTDEIKLVDGLPQLESVAPSSSSASASSPADLVEVDGELLEEVPFAGKGFDGRENSLQLLGAEPHDAGSIAPGDEREIHQTQVRAEREARERINRDLYLKYRVTDGRGRRNAGRDGKPDGDDQYSVEGDKFHDVSGMPLFEHEADPAGGGMGGSRMGLSRASGSAAPNSNSEAYAPITENPFLPVGEHPLSTFSIDVDTASYANVRRFINTHVLPPPNAVRIEELINYFSYDYPQPEGNEPFSVTTEVAGCPWNADHRLLRVGLKGRTLDPSRRPASNLVFLLDVSGSMDEPNKLPLVKEAMQLLTEQLTENDRVAIVVYAGSSGLVLPPTRGNEREKICAAIAGLTAGGSTNGGQGIQLAYEAAQAHFVPGGTNRVILATDGDFNVGVTDTGDLVRLIEEKAAGGVSLSTLGFGAGNFKDATLEQLADRGNGNYAYIDTAGEARKVLVEQLCGTLVTIAKDVKLQIEFNPAQVGAYRLIGYENRLMREQDFNDDRKDAGEIGAGHTVTALYELVPSGKAAPGGVDALKYQRVPRLAEAAGGNELATLALRYKPPAGEKSKRLEHVITDAGIAYGRASRDFKFAASVAACGMLLRGSQFAGDATWDAVIELAGEGLGEDPHPYRAEFLELVRKAKGIAER